LLSTGELAHQQCARAALPRPAAVSSRVAEPSLARWIGSERSALLIGTASVSGAHCAGLVGPGRQECVTYECRRSDAPQAALPCAAVRNRSSVGGALHHGSPQQYCYLLAWHCRALRCFGLLRVVGSVKPSGSGARYTPAPERAAAISPAAQWPCEPLSDRRSSRSLRCCKRSQPLPCLRPLPTARTDDGIVFCMRVRAAHDDSVQCGGLGDGPGL
jgi:hypothetical protein